MRSWPLEEALPASGLCSACLQVLMTEMPSLAALHLANRVLCALMTFQPCGAGMEIDQKDHETDVLHVVSEFADVPLCFVIEDWEVGPEVPRDVEMLVTQQHLLTPSGTSPGNHWEESKAPSLASCSPLPTGTGVHTHES